MKTTTITAEDIIITNSQIRDLRSEAGNAGDEALVETCTRALQGHQAAVETCHRIISTRILASQD